MNEKNEKIYIKFLSGEIFTLETHFKNNDDIILKLNSIQNIKFPLKRTKIIKEEDNIYNVYINPYLYLYLFNSIDNITISDMYKDYILNKEGIVIGKFRDDTMYYIKFTMPDSTKYRVFVLEEKEDSYIDILSMYDTNNIDDALFNAKKLNKISGTHIIVVLDCDGNVPFLGNSSLEKTENTITYDFNLLQ